MIKIMIIIKIIIIKIIIIIMITQSCRTSEVEGKGEFKKSMTAI